MRDFIKSLRESHQIVLVMAEYLRNLNYQVTLIPNKERDKRENWKSFVDDCDLYLNVPIEVKQTKLVAFPNGISDWPFPMVNVMATHAWESKNPKPLFVAIVSKDCKNAAIIHKDTEKFWVKQDSKDRRDGETQSILKCPKDKCRWVSL